MPSILIIDDDRSVVQVFRRGFQNTEINVLAADCAAEGLGTLARDHPEVVLLDIFLPDQSGLATFEQIHQFDSTIPVIFVTASGTSNTAIEAIKLGAFDYILKPLDFNRVREVVQQALKIRHFINVPVRVIEAGEKHAADTDAMVGRSPAMQDVYKAIGRIAGQSVNVLIRGESGTGKELVARAIYQHSPRAAGRFLAVNCAAIPEPLLESELFGHEKGAFTGADSKRIGKFEQCSGGTLFLDEVGDMTPLMQSKVLRVLQEQRFERVGGNETIQTDVWIIAATNRNLEHMLGDGSFRPDLYYRLNGFSIKLPPLRERAEDIPLLIEHFVALYGLELGKSRLQIPDETMDLLVKYSWPGNVRELQSVLRQALLQTTGPILLSEFLPFPVSGGQLPTIEDGDQSGLHLNNFIEERLRAGSEGLYGETLAFMERHLLARVLRHCQGNQSRAAKILGITRGSLRSKIRLLGITINQAVNVEEDAGEAEYAPLFS